MSSVSFAQPDVTLRLDLSGIIRRAALSNSISGEPIADWVGHAWADTVAEGGHAQIRQMLDDARTAGVSPFHQVRQRFPSGLELGVEYTTVRLGGDGGLIAIGRNLEAVSELRSRLVAAQVSMERDYWKLREVETRYRLLFDASAQPVLLISADELRVVEANPAAIRALGFGTDFEVLPELVPGQRDAFLAMLARVREQGKAPGIVIHLGPDRQPWLVRASLVASAPVFVLQLSPSGSAAPVLIEQSPDIGWAEMIARLPDPFVVVDVTGTLTRVNRAFLDLIEHSTESSVVGQSLGRWMSLPSADAGVLMGSLRHVGAIRQFKSRIYGELGAETPIEVTAACNADTNPRFVGVLLRRDSAHDQTRRSSSPSPTRAPSRGTLRQIMRTTLGSVEREAIEAALALANGNRTVAAQRLGVSRQTLYMKLNRYAAEQKSTPAKKKKPNGQR